MAGIHLHSDYCNISHNTVSNNWHCIFLDWSHHNRITGNIASNNVGSGIWVRNTLWEGYNIIANNTCSNNNNHGIRLESSWYNIITNNICSNNALSGIVLKDSYYNTITKNTCPNNKIGIGLGSSAGNSIVNNTCSNNRDGIHLAYSGYNDIKNNIVKSHILGIYLIGSRNHVITDNRFENCGICIDTGIYHGLSYFNTHTIERNTINGKPIYYYKDTSSIKVPEDAGEVIIANCNNMTVENIDASNGSAGIEVAYTMNSIISNNIISNNHYRAICLTDSNNNRIISNNVSKSGSIILRYSNNNYIGSNTVNNSGIWLYDSDSNLIVNNSVYNGRGIDVDYGSFNNIRQNTFFNNSHGVQFCRSSSNIITLNNFINNSHNAYCTYSINIWNSPEKITYTYNGRTYTRYLGNYWSDYKGIDEDDDGIGDTPYYNIHEKLIAPKRTGNDSYPLMKPFENYLLIYPPEDQPPTQPPQPINLSPVDGATDVSLTPQLLSSPPLQDVDKELIPWEEIDGLWVTRVDSQWQITTTPGDYSDPVWDSTLTDGLIDRRFFPDLLDAWANWIPSGVLDYETTYYWRVRHRDFRGVWSSWSEETSFTTRRYVPPEAAFDYFPERPKSGDKVKLDASASRPGETWSISYYRWDLDGDGTFDGLTTSPVMYYRWYESGTYSVTLEVVNWLGDSDTISREITVDQNSWWERTWAAIKKIVFGPEGPTEEDWRRFEIIKRELRLEEFDEFYDPAAPISVRDMQILMALNEKIPVEEGEITYEEYILQVLHDMALVDSYVNYPWIARPKVNEYFTKMAEVNKWAEGFLIVGPKVFPHGIGSILMIPKVVQAGISLKFLYDTLYSRALWLYFNDPNQLPLNFPGLKAEQIAHFEKLREEYASPLKSRGEEFKQEVREKLRTFLYSVLEKYKLLPVHAYHSKSPVELRVYDSQGNVTGLVDGKVREEIVGSAYVDGTVVIYPATDLYHLVVAGTDEGAYGLTVISVTAGEVLNFTATDIPTSINTFHQYTIDWEALSLGQEGVTVQIDSEGDGLFEHSFTSDNELSPSEYVAAIHAVNAWITDSDFNEIETFRAVFTPYGNTELYKLTATNPGQFYFNIFVNNTWSETLNITIVYLIDADFILKGAKPIHAYADLNRTIDITENCAFSDNTITVYNVAPNAIIYVTIHLDYALKGTTWTAEEVEAWYSEHGFSATVRSITSKVVITDPELQIPAIPSSLIFLTGVLPAIILCLSIIIALLKYALLPTKRRK